jgi:hypothetical protein
VDPFRPFSTLGDSDADDAEEDDRLFDWQAL